MLSHGSILLGILSLETLHQSLTKQIKSKHHLSLSSNNPHLLPLRTLRRKKNSIISVNIGESGTLNIIYIYLLLLLGLGIIDSLTPPCCASSPRSGHCTCPLLACSNWENSTRKKSGLLMSYYLGTSLNPGSFVEGTTWGWWQPSATLLPHGF